MPKKIDRGEPKKECPSCGLGVSLEANICEFCGWDFEEEDEWILQIEKLERELLLEKKKFEPGTVNHKIESTLINPAKEKAEAERDAARAPQPEVARPQRVAHTAEDLIERESTPPRREPEQAVFRPAPVPQAAPRPAPTPVRPEPAPVAVAEAPQEAPKIRKVRNVRPPAERPAPEPAPQPVAQPAPQPAPQPVPQRQAQGPPLQERRVKIPEPETVRPAAAEPPTRKVRTVRKVKG